MYQRVTYVVYVLTHNVCLLRLRVSVKPSRLQSFSLASPPRVAPRGEEEVPPTLYQLKVIILRVTKTTLIQSELSCVCGVLQEIAVLCVQ